MKTEALLKTALSYPLKSYNGTLDVFPYQSKWGINVVYLHNLSYRPYSIGNIIYYVTS